MAPRIGTKLSLIGKACVFANCLTIGKKLPPDSGITFYQFAKPCKQFINEEIAYVTNAIKVRNHKPKNCTQCSKALRWIRLARRADNRFQQLSDITKNTFVCSLHFVDDGPTERNPDPMPANAPSSVCEQQCGRKRQAPAKQVKRHSPSDSVEGIGASEMPAREVNRLDFGCQMPESKVNGLHFGCQMPEHEETTNLSIATLTRLAREYVTCGWATCISDEDVNFIKYDTNTLSCVIAVRLHRSSTSTDFNGQWTCNVFVRGQPIPIKTDVFAEASAIKTIQSLKDFLWLISNLHVCDGITNTNLIGKFEQQKHRCGFRCAWSDAVRSAGCKLLTQGHRCSNCLKYESTLQLFYKRREMQTKCRSKCNNRYLTVGALVEKAAKYKKMVKVVKRTNKRLKDKIQTLLDCGDAICNEDIDDSVHV